MEIVKLWSIKKLDCAYGPYNECGARLAHKWPGGHQTLRRGKIGRCGAHVVGIDATSNTRNDRAVFIGVMGFVRVISLALILCFTMSSTQLMAAGTVAKMAREAALKLEEASIKLAIAKVEKDRINALADHSGLRSALSSFRTSLSNRQCETGPPDASGVKARKIAAF